MGDDTRKRKGERTRQSILEKAAPIFNQKGYSGTALADVMAATGLEKGGIYRHFGSKEELAAEAFAYAWAKVSQPRVIAPGPAAEGLARLRCMVESFGERPPDTMPGGCPLLNTAVEADDTNPVLRRQARAALGEWRTSLEQAARTAIAAGEMDGDTDPVQLAVVLIATLEGALVMSRLERDKAALHAAKRHLLGWLDQLARPRADAV